MTKQQAKYFQFEPDAFLSDIDFQAMTGAERGCYCTIIFYLYRNNGKVENDLALLAKICNVNLNFDFSFVFKKFNNKNGFLTHNKVSEVIKKTQAIRNERVKAGKLGGLKGKQMLSKCLASADSLLDLSKVKVSKDNNINNIHTQHMRNFENFEGIACKFSIDECRGQALLVGITQEQAEQFYNHYNSQGWKKSNGLLVEDLASQMAVWKQNQFRFEGKKNERSGIFENERTGKNKTGQQARDFAKTGVESFADQTSKYGIEISND